VLDEDEELVQVKSLAVTTDLVRRIKKIIYELFAKYYKFFDDKILFMATAIDPRCKNLEFEGAILKFQDCLRSEYNQITSNEDFESLSRENVVDQYLMIESIGPLDNPLQ
ncbi:22796_t:CDS:2, partial [Racocetra persica]